MPKKSKSIETILDIPEQVPPGVVIGVDGQVVKLIFKETRARVQVIKKGQQVRIRGSRTAVKAATVKVQAIITQYSNQFLRNFKGKPKFYIMLSKVFCNRPFHFELSKECQPVPLFVTDKIHYRINEASSSHSKGRNARKNMMQTAQIQPPKHAETRISSYSELSAISNSVFEMIQQGQVRLYDGELEEFGVYVNFGQSLFYSTSMNTNLTTKLLSQKDLSCIRVGSTSTHFCQTIFSNCLNKSTAQALGVLFEEKFAFTKKPLEDQLICHIADDLKKITTNVYLNDVMPHDQNLTVKKVEYGSIRQCIWTILDPMPSSLDIRVKMLLKYRMDDEMQARLLDFSKHLYWSTNEDKIKVDSAKDLEPLALDSISRRVNRHQYTGIVENIGEVVIRISNVTRDIRRCSNKAFVGCTENYWEVDAQLTSLSANGGAKQQQLNSFIDFLSVIGNLFASRKFPWPGKNIH